MTEFGVDFGCMGVVLAHQKMIRSVRSHREPELRSRPWWRASCGLINGLRPPSQEQHAACVLLTFTLLIVLLVQQRQQNQSDREILA